MIDKSHIQKFKSCQLYVPSNRSIKNLKDNIYFFIPIVRFFIEKYEIDTVSDLKSSIEYFVDLVFDSCSKSGYVDSRLYEIQAIDSIIKDPSFIKNTYPEVKGKPNTHTIYTANLSRSKRLVLINALDEIATAENFAKDYSITKDTKPQNVVVNINDPETSEKVKKLIGITIDLLKNDKLEDKIMFMLKAHKADSEAFVKQSQISFLNELYSFFDTFGLLNSYLSNYEFNCSRFGLSELNYELSTNSYDKNSIGLDESFSEDFLATLPIKDLCYLSTFWCNRFAKEVTKMTSAFSAIDSMDLWQDILDNKTTFSMSDEALKASLQKSNYLAKILGESFTIYQNNVLSREIAEGTNFSSSFSKDYTNYYGQLHNFIGKDYFNYFSTYLDGNNSLLGDASFAAHFVNLEMYAYAKKDSTLEPLIKDLLNSPHMKNWGIIREEFSDGSYVDSISSGKSKLLFSFDVEGFNMPFRFHMPKDNLLDLAKSNGSTPLVPEYQGGKDFIFNDEVIPSTIIMPVPKRHKQTIINNANGNIPSKNLWEHLYFLMNGKFPKHLCEPILKSKKQEILSRLPVYYTNLETGKRYVKNNNRFIEVDDENVR